MRWTQAEYERYINDHFNELAYFSDDVPDEGSESVLAGKIQKWARDKGYPCQSNRQTKRAKGLLTPGWPDVCLILPKGKVLFLELKGSSGRLSDEQKRLALQFMTLGSPIHRITSFKGFLSLVGQMGIR